MVTSVEFYVSLFFSTAYMSTLISQKTLRELLNLIGLCFPHLYEVSLYPIISKCLAVQPTVRLLLMLFTDHGCTVNNNACIAFIIRNQQAIIQASWALSLPAIPSPQHHSVIRTIYDCFPFSENCFLLFDPGSLSPFHFPKQVPIRFGLLKKILARSSFHFSSCIFFFSCLIQKRPLISINL